MRRLVPLVAIGVSVLAQSGCATTASDDPHRAVVYRDYTARTAFEVLYRGVLLASWEVMTQDLGARVDPGSFDPLRPPAPSPSDPRPEHTLRGRIGDLEQLGDVELEVRVSRPELFSADVAGDGGAATVQVRLSIRTSVAAELVDDRLADREFVERTFWDALDARLEGRIGPYFTAGRPRSSP
jgi:hypothetical protein